MSEDKPNIKAWPFTKREGTNPPAPSAEAQEAERYANDNRAVSYSEVAARAKAKKDWLAGRASLRGELEGAKAQELAVTEQAIACETELRTQLREANEKLENMIKDRDEKIERAQFLEYDRDQALEREAALREALEKIKKHKGMCMMGPPSQTSDEIVMSCDGSMDNAIHQGFLCGSAAAYAECAGEAEEALTAHPAPKEEETNG